MSQIIIEIKDGYEVAVAKSFANFSYPPNQIPPTGEHLAAIKSKIYELINFSYEQAVKQDPEVIAKEAELAALISQKLLATKEAVKG